MATALPRQNKVLILTGASAGVGRAIAHRFAEAGYGIGLIARDAEALEDVKREVEARGGTAFCAPADVSDAKALFEARDRIEEALGPVDVWVNDAMETVFSFFEEIEPEVYARVTNVTYLGFVHGTMAALKSMRRRNRGTIVQIGSALGYRGIPLQSAYCGAKHAIRGFTDSVRSELIAQQSGIRLTIVDLPAVNTPQFDWARTNLDHAPRPMGTPVEPEVVADAVYKAAHGIWREYWLGRSTIEVILGNTVLPGFLDHYLVKSISGQQRKQLTSPTRQDNLDHPVTSLHRTRGSFSQEASDDAVLLPGEVARVGAVALGAALFFGAGALAAQMMHRSRARA